MQERFETFHKIHSDLYEQFKQVSYEILVATKEHKQKYSATFILDIMRYHAILVNKPFPKVLSSYTTRYAGLLVQEDKQFETFFVSWVI